MTINFNPFDYSTQTLFDIQSQPIGLNGVYDKAIIGFTSVNQSFDDIKLTTISPLHRGDKVIYNNKRWLVIGDVSISRHGKYKAITRKVTHPVKIQTGTEQVPTGTYDGEGNPIMKTVPVYKDCEIIMMNAPTVSVGSTQGLVYVDGKTVIVVKDEPDTPFVPNFEFDLAGVHWKVTYQDKSKVGLLYISLDNLTAATTEDQFLADPVMPEPPAEPVVPSEPLNVVSSNISDTSATISWDSVSNADSYTVYRDNVAIQSGLSVLTYTDNNLTASTSYNYQVSAINEVGESQKSATLNVITNAEPLPIPDTPTGLTSSNITNNSVTLTWNSSTNATSYTIYRNDEVYMTGITDTTYNDTGLSGNTGYNYQVLAVNGSGSSALTDYLSVLTLTDAPTGLASSNITYDSATLTWTDINYVTFTVYRDGISIVSDLTDATYTDTGLTAETTYQYQVSAINSTGESPKSAQVGVTTVAQPVIPDAPTNLIATANGETEIDLTWNTVANADTYNVYRDSVQIITGLTSPSYNNTGLTSGTNYSYEVTAVNEVGESAHSNSASATTDAPISYTDNFDRANASTLGTDWTLAYGTGTSAIENNTAKVITGASQTAYFLHEMGTTNGDFQVKIINPVNSQRFIFRYGGSSNVGMLLVNSDMTYKLLVNGGAWQTSIPSGTATAQNGDVMKIHLDGSNIQLYKNETSIYSGTMTSVPTGTQYGLGMYNGTAYFDDVSFTPAS